MYCSHRYARFRYKSKVTYSTCHLNSPHNDLRYEDTLLELEEASQKAGFRVIAAVEAVAEHTIVRQFAAFGEKI